MQMRYNMKK